MQTVQLLIVYLRQKCLQVDLGARYKWGEKKITVGWCDSLISRAENKLHVDPAKSQPLISHSLLTVVQFRLKAAMHAH